MALHITSPAFGEGGSIPAKFTCTGQDISPALAWTGAPDGVRSYALIMDDPDAPRGTWVHWVVFNLPGDRSACRRLWPGCRRAGHQLLGPDRLRWSVPAERHAPLFFKLYALDTALNHSRASKEDVLGQWRGTSWRRAS